MARAWFKKPKVLSYSEVVLEIEKDALSRLRFVEEQLQRLTDLRRVWSPHLTVADLDIVPFGRRTQILHVVRRFETWQILAAGMLFSAFCSGLLVWLLT